VLGFLNYNGQDVDPYVVQGRVDSSTVIACFDSFCNKIKKPTTVVIDNAPVHTSALFQSKIPQWEMKNLFLWFLPAYCPELNLIEMLWKKIKYDWMPISAYQSFENLDQELISILETFGNNFNINFS